MPEESSVPVIPKPGNSGVSIPSAAVHPSYLVSTYLCGYIALAGMLFDFILRLRDVQNTGTLTALAGVALGALAAGVPSWPAARAPGSNGEKTTQAPAGPPPLS